MTAGVAKGGAPAAALPRVLFLNRFYWPDVAATGQMLADLAEDLAAAGWDVQVIASMGAYAAGGAALPRNEVRNGVRIHRVAATRFGQGTLAGRLGDYLAYLGGACLAALRAPRPDLVVAMTDPPITVALAAYIARRRGVAAVYWVQDVYPQLAAALGVVAPGSLPYRASLAVARWAHARCAAVITQGPRMTRILVANGAPPARTRDVANWADAAAIVPVPPGENAFLHEQGLAGQFVVLYSGNAGRGHTFEAVLGAMERLRDDSGISFVFVGGGQQRPFLEAEVARRGLTRARFLDYLPRAMLAQSLSAASVSLVTERPEAAGLLLPSKTFGIMASGRPILFVGAVDSDVAAVIRSADAGVIVAPDDPDGLARELRRLRDDPAEAARLGANGRRAAERTHARSVATAAWATTVRTLTGRIGTP
ncbi:MAG: glycosyltransferase family 4 protein [Gemmatimonadetes bacterium]|nr:glycosyltransferase family 4 protein [Gemmatimonadota bacterium]